MLKPFFLAINALKAEYEQKYDEVIFEVSPSFNQEGDLILQGFTLLSKQKTEAEERLKKIFAGKIINKLSVLIKSASSPKYGWGKLKKGIFIADIFRKPMEDLNKYSALEINRLRSTQITPEDPGFAVLWKIGNWYLVQLFEGTIGWINKEFIALQNQPIKKPVYFYLLKGRSEKNEKQRPCHPAPFCQGKKVLDPLLSTKRDSSTPPSFANSFTKVTDFKKATEGSAQNDSFPEIPISKKKFQILCQKYLGIPYLLGGNSLSGIDCSALTQRLYREAFKIVIPKKSLDQARVLKLIKPKKKFLTWGRLLFMERKNKNQRPHVGICFDGKEKLVLHGCLKNRRVAIEHWSSLRKNYRLLSIGKLN